MLNKIKTALGFGAKPKSADVASLGIQKRAQKVKVTSVSDWAGLQGWNYSKRSDGSGGYQLEGEVGGKPWRIEQGKPSRDFIKGSELRARAALDINDDVAIMVMNRQLKNVLEKHAFALYTDSLQTIANPHLPEEMRWLSIYEEVGWEGLGASFLDNYAVLADNRAHAVQWLDAQLVDSLMHWPEMDPSVPKILMLLRGKVYLRMQHTQNDISTLEHAIQVFTNACSQAQASFAVDVSL
jgi:hypothetical protein